MNEEDIKKKISIAEESVEDIKDEKLKQKAFEIVLNNLLTGARSYSPIHKPRETISTKIEKEKIFKFEPNALANALGENIDELKNIIDFSEDDFHFIGEIPGKSEGDKQRNAALIILTIRNHVMGDREINATELRSIMDDLGIGSLVNMASNLKLIVNMIRKIGKPGSPSTIYRITDPGIRRGSELIREVLQTTRES